MATPRIEHSNLIADALYYASPRSACSTQMGHGVVVGVVSTLMAMGYDFYAAIEKVALLLPSDVAIGAIPEAWRGVLVPPKGD